MTPLGHHADSKAMKMFSRLQNFLKKNKTFFVFITQVKMVRLRGIMSRRTIKKANSAQG